MLGTDWIRVVDTDLSLIHVFWIPRLDTMLDIVFVNFVRTDISRYSILVSDSVPE